MLDRKAVESLEYLYKLYGFKKIDQTANEIVFIYSHGYFNNAEIVCLLEDCKELDETVERYQELGYSARKVHYENVEQAHRSLFDGFFATDTSRKRLLKEYKNFSDKQSQKLIKSKYEYVSCKYFDGNAIRNDTKIIDFLYAKLLSEGPQLVILEAAAGFGKTCTTFEIVNSFATQNNGKTPIFTELSKNRKATLFRYVLLDEIDRNFTALSSELVQYEISNGLVPLIIDGFDELISKSASVSQVESSQEQFEETQTMLDTIAELFDKNANTKILLTSRKSSIFTGDIFNQWVDNRLSNCEITRVSIEEPRVIDWLGYEKQEVLYKKKVPYSSIANPILLSILRDMSFSDFEKYCSEMNKVIDFYFESILEREKERQSLMLERDEQYMILTKLAGLMVEFDISSEEISFIKDMVLDITKDIIQDIGKRYILAENRPSEDEFAMKLARHALLNRNSATKNEIGFVNEFIFGIFIAEAILLGVVNLENVGEKYIDIACTAFAVKEESSRQELFVKIEHSLNGFNQEMVLGVDMKLNRTLKRDYKDLYLDSIIFRKDFSTGFLFQFYQCIFINCTFDQCEIMTSAFKSCQFIDCTFYNTKININSNDSRELTFASCTNSEKFANAAKYNPKMEESNTNYERVLLEQFWKVSRPKADLRKDLSILFRGLSPNEIHGFEQAVSSLKNKDIIIKNGQYLLLNMEKLNDIKNILGR